MDRDPPSSQRIENGLQNRLARLNARWRVFTRRNQDETTTRYMQERERYQAEARALQLAISRAAANTTNLQSQHQPPPAAQNSNPHRKFTERWSFIGKMVSCTHCKATMWLGEKIRSSSISQPRFTLCCQNGQVILSSLPPAPPPLDTLLNDPNFSRHIRAYNSMLSFTSMGGTIDYAVMDGHGPYSFRISGQNYHHIGSLLPTQGRKPRFAQLYIYDTDDEVRNRCRALNSQQSVNGVDLTILEALQRMLDSINPYVRVFRNARDVLHANNIVDLRIRIIQARPGRQYTRPTADEVAALIVGGEHTDGETRDIIVCKIDGNLQRIYETHPSYMPLQYPLLFPYGTDGWSEHIPCVEGSSSNRRYVTMREFYAFLIQYRVNE